MILHSQLTLNTKKVQVQTFFTLALQKEADARLNNTIFNRMQKIKRNDALKKLQSQRTNGVDYFLIIK